MSGGRECGDCRACCTVLGVHDLAKEPHTKCEHACASGCAIYQERPESCRTYSCGWLGGSVDGGRSMRPDRLGVILDRPANLGGTIVAREVWRGAFARRRVKQVLERIHRAGFKVQLAPFAGRALPVGRPL